MNDKKILMEACQEDKVEWKTLMDAGLKVVGAKDICVTYEIEHAYLYRH